MKIKIYSSTLGKVPQTTKRRRIGEYTKEILSFKKSMTIEEKIKADFRLLALGVNTINKF